MAVSEAQRRANERYRKKNVRTKTVQFYPADEDLLAFVDENDEPFSGYVRRLIREDMERRRGASS